MPYEIFNDIEEFKAQVGGAINTTMELDSIGPHISMAATNHLVQWLGEEQWAELVDYVIDPPGTTNTELDALLPYVRKPLAFLTLEEYANIGSVQFGEAGLFRTENETHKTAYKYQENNYRESMLKNGYEAIELMLKFLEDNSGDYALWTASPASLRNRSLVINTAATFRQIYSLAISRHTFEMLRPLMEDVEWLALYPVIGGEQYEDVKTKIAEKTLGDSQPKEKVLLPLLQKAVAYFTVQEAIRRNQVQVVSNRIVVTEALEPQSNRKESPAGTGAIKLAHRHNDEMANRYISRILKYLNENEDDFPIYKAWKAAKITAEETAQAEAEADYARFPCGCCGSCSCTNTYTKPKPIIRF